ncbi:hypothetical protein PZ895_12290 [Mesorhizobium sp. YIM 152430]|uniref:hypothetical protein n=1 Tax=Mesorhizobium sp. YIM 152430 TaxID=3031761 RepID=UPI0023DB24DB|nr:hypothetical protein [Mesorhizobium sp. YIM 152430]MDF1600539.1 hypothetical protein [Mesorhizobium sp. YIM 152430]
MTCLRPLFLILAFCLAFTAPAQAGGWPGAGSETCRHLTAGAKATQVTAPDAIAQDGIAAACHAMCAIVEADATLPADDSGADRASIEHSLDLSLRPWGIERPPKV